MTTPCDCNIDDMEHSLDCENEGSIVLFGWLYDDDDDEEIKTQTKAPKLNIFSSTEDWNEYFTLDDDEETTLEFPRFETQLNFSKKLRSVLNQWWQQKPSTTPLKTEESREKGRESYSTELKHDKTSIVFKHEFRRNISTTDTAEVLEKWSIFKKKVVETLVSITKVYLEQMLDFNTHSSFTPMDNFAKIESRINDFMEPVFDEAAILKTAENARKWNTRNQLLRSFSIDTFLKSLEYFLKSCYKSRVIRIFDQERFDYLTESEITIVENSAEDNEFQEPEIILGRKFCKFDNSVDWFLKTRSSLKSLKT